MYDTCETMSENMSETEKVTTPNKTELLTSAPKIEFLHESPDLRQSKPIVAIRIECGID